jgi:hypothetical protein
MRGILALLSAYGPSNKRDVEVQFMFTIEERLPGEKAGNICSMTSRKKKVLFKSISTNTTILKRTSSEPMKETNRTNN